MDLDVLSLWGPWLVEANRLLEDKGLIKAVLAAAGKRHEHSARLGRGQTPAEVMLDSYC